MASIPRNRIVVFFLIAVAGCALDLWTKHWIFAKLGLPAKEPIVIWPGVFSLTTTLNEGALFGLGQGMVWVFATLSVVAVIGICYWLFYLGAGKDWILTIPLAMIMGGIFGNLYDRLGMPGLKWNDPDRLGEPVYAVRDWLHFCLRRADNSVLFDWPVFNIADCLLVCGSILLIWYGFRYPQDSPSPAPAKSSGGTTS
ncbi:MAG: signal peptidase II [Planctomycetota bacterium]|nr:signal peptidase II [Planctomycetota bacterium]